MMIQEGGEGTTFVVTSQGHQHLEKYTNLARLNSKACATTIV